MSRIGNAIINIPSGVDVKLNGNLVNVKGPKGELSREMRPEVQAKIEDGVLSFSRTSDAKAARAFHGMERALVNNLIEGVNTGFVKELELIGTGYRADMKGKVLNMDLGYSHDINMEIPDGVKASVVKEGRQIFVKIEGCDKQQVGQVAAKIRDFRKPEPYKGKGVRYRGEHIIKKAGKSGK